MREKLINESNIESVVNGNIVILRSSEDSPGAPNTPYIVVDSRNDDKSLSKLFSPDEIPITNIVFLNNSSFKGCNYGEDHGYYLSSNQDFSGWKYLDGKEVRVVK